MATTSSTHAAAARWLRVLPTPFATVVLALGGVLVAITAGKGLRDPDFFWHLTTGELIVRSGSVPSTDPFSFTWQGQPWTPHEWLSEVLIYGLVETFGRIGALLVFGLIPALAIGVLAVMLARQGAGLLGFTLPAVLTSLVIAPYVTLRPQAISWLLLAILLWFLATLRPERPGRALWLIPLFVLWANLHGLYVVGLGVVATYGIFTVAGRTAMSAARWWFAAGAIGAVLASMATPAGPIGLFYPLRYVDGGDWGLANIEEWQSPSFHEPAHLAFLALIVAVGLNGGRRTPGWLVMLSWVGVAMGLLALRNIPIAAVFALPTLALGLSDRLRSWRGDRSPRSLPPRVALVRRVMELVAAAAVVVGAQLVLVPWSSSDQVRDAMADRFPIASIERLQDSNPDVRLLAEYGWAGYAISELYPTGGRVFVDGRNDMYSQDILEDYSAIRAADDGWESLVDRYGVEAILLPPSAPVVRGFAQDAGWCEVYADGIQVLLVRECDG